LGLDFLGFVRILGWVLVWELGVLVGGFGFVLWWLIAVGNLSADFGDAAIVLELFSLLFSAVSGLLDGFDASVNFLQLNDAGGIQLGVFATL
jgi:hypothetical protein